MHFKRSWRRCLIDRSRHKHNVAFQVLEETFLSDSFFWNSVFNSHCISHWLLEECIQVWSLQCRIGQKRTAEWSAPLQTWHTSACFSCFWRKNSDQKITEYNITDSLFMIFRVISRIKKNQKNQYGAYSTHSTMDKGRSLLMVDRFLGNSITTKIWLIISSSLYKCYRHRSI